MFFLGLRVGVGTFAVVVEVFDDFFEVAAAEGGENFLLILAIDDDVTA